MAGALKTCRGHKPRLVRYHGSHGRPPATRLMKTAILDFTESEQELVSTTLFERYGKLVWF